MKSPGTYQHRILVAGATGYLGGYVTKELHQRGYFVRALARSARKLDPMLEYIDERFTGEATHPDSLVGVCDGMDEVFSSIGITRQQDGLTFRDVDYQGNMNLLHEAVKSGVKKFVYVSVLNGDRLRHLDIVAAHEDFVDALKASGMDYAIVRPTGYFSDMGEMLEMARKGRVWLIGSGKNRCNPIHGADLAAVCVDAIEGNETEIAAGGPETMTWQEVAARAFSAVGRSSRITHVPVRLVWAVVRTLRLFSRHQSELFAFFTTMMTTDMVAPSTGTHTLTTHYHAQREEANGYQKALIETDYHKNPSADVCDCCPKLKQRVVELEKEIAYLKAENEIMTSGVGSGWL